MRLERARFGGLPSTTKPSANPKTRKNRRSSQPRHPRIRCASLTRLDGRFRIRETIFESHFQRRTPPRTACQELRYKRRTDPSVTGVDASSSWSPAYLTLSTNGLELDDDRNPFGGLLGSNDTRDSRTNIFFRDDETKEPIGLPGIATPADRKVGHRHHGRDVPKTNDLELTSGLDDACTAFRVQSREHNHSTTGAWARPMEDRRGHEASKEKEKEEDEDARAFGLPSCREESSRVPETLGIVVSRTARVLKREFAIPENEAATPASLDIYVGTRENGSAGNVASVDACGLIDFSSPERSPYDALDNTAFTDDDDYGYKNDDGDNSVDYDNYNDDDDYGCNDCCNDCGVTDCCCTRCNRVEGSEDDTSRRSVSTASRRLDNTKRSCDSRRLHGGLEGVRREEKANSLDDHDGNSRRRILETNACVDVPGGRLRTRIGPSGSYIRGGGRSFAGNETDIVFSTKDRQTELLGDEKSRDLDGRYPRSSHQREKWKRPRGRRRKKCAASTDKRVPLAKERCKGDEEGSAYTARLGGPVDGVEDERGRRRNWSFKEKLAKTREEASARGRCPAIGETRGVARKHRSARSESKRGARRYGLLFVLYLLALPILCSTDPSAPVAAAFAQKSPLTHSDNFTARNSSLQHQGHQARRDGVPGHDSSHPYNEYTWEVNQINPWLSACDLAGPAPADLQGSCGPPEVPKNCPMPCATDTQTEGNGAFREVIERLGVHDRAKSGAGGSRWRPAGTTTTTTTSTNKKNNNKEENGKKKRTEETATAPEQCLFYLEESHKRNICRDNFGRGSSLSFSNSRENRYWFMSGLRLRHCCEHPVVNALAPGKGGPLEDVLNGGRKCAEALDKLLLVDALAARLHCEFEEVLARYDCAQPYSVIYNCTQCKEAYRKWVCSSLVPYFAHGGPPALESSSNAWSGSRLRPCRSFCQSVEQRCPYLLPGDRAPAYPTQYAGEPTFLCRDPNIPETGEQATRALHGNEEEECCFHVCSEVEPGSGVCANCTDRRLHGHRAGHDAPTAPQCEITSTSSIQSGSTGHQNNAEVSSSSSSSHGSGIPESAAASSSPSTTTSASFCGGGGVGSLSSSSGQSTTQTPPPTSISLICLFWIWAALISLCTGQTIFPWAPPSSLLMPEHSSRGGAVSSRRSSGYSRSKKSSSSEDSSSGSSRRVVEAAATRWLRPSSGPSLSSPSSSRPRFSKSVLQLARVFFVSLSKTMDDNIRSLVNIFLVLVDSLVRRCSRTHRWYGRRWRFTRCIVSARLSCFRWSLSAVIGWSTTRESKESSRSEGPARRLEGGSRNERDNEPRPPRGRRRRRRRGRRRRRRRRRRRPPPPPPPAAHLPPRVLLRALSNARSVATGPAGIAGQPPLAPNPPCCYGRACASFRWWRLCRLCRSQRRSYSYRKWKGPS